MTEQHSLECTKDNEHKDAKKPYSAIEIKRGVGPAGSGDTVSDPVHITGSHLCRHIHER